VHHGGVKCSSCSGRLRPSRGKLGPQLPPPVDRNPLTLHHQQVSFPQPRLALLTADAGKFAKSDAKCPSRQVIDRTKSFTPSATQAAELTVPCTREWLEGRWVVHSGRF